MTEDLDGHGLPPLDQQPDPADTLFVVQMLSARADVMGPDGQPHAGFVLNVRGENQGDWTQCALFLPHGAGALTQLRDELSAYVTEFPES